MKPSFKDFNSEREKAMSWWNKLSIAVKVTITKPHYPDRTIFSLTGREIQELYKHHKPV